MQKYYTTSQRKMITLKRYITADKFHTCEMSFTSFKKMINDGSIEKVTNYVFKSPIQTTKTDSIQPDSSDKLIKQQTITNTTIFYIDGAKDKFRKFFTIERAKYTSQITYNRHALHENMYNVNDIWKSVRYNIKKQLNDSFKSYYHFDRYLRREATKCIQQLLNTETIKSKADVIIDGYIRLQCILLNVNIPNDINSMILNFYSSKFINLRIVNDMKNITTDVKYLIHNEYTIKTLVNIIIKTHNKFSNCKLKQKHIKVFVQWKMLTNLSPKFRQYVTLSNKNKDVNGDNEWIETRRDCWKWMRLFDREFTFGENTIMIWIPRQ
eukprot:443497_1